MQDGRPPLPRISKPVAVDRTDDCDDRYWRLLAASPQPVVVVDRQRVIRLVNAAWLQLFGALEAQVLGRDVLSFIDPGDRDAATRRLELLVRPGHAGAANSFESVRCIRLDGEPLEVEVVAVPVQIEGRAATQLLVRDLTERHRTEAALRTSRERLTTILQIAGDAIIAINRQGEVLFFNEAAEGMFGYAADEIVGHRIQDLSTLGTPDQWCEANRLLDDERVVRFAADEGAQAVRKDGTRFPIEGSVARLTQGREQIFTVVVRDVSEQVAQATALRQAHAELAQLLASVPSILIELDAEGRVRVWNQAASSILGVPAREAVGRQLADCPAPWDAEAILAPVGRFRATGRPMQADAVRFRRPDGSDGLLGVTVHPMAGDSAGSGCLLVGADVTERRHLESQLAQAQKLESIGQLAAGIAHEINTPIQFVGDNTRFLKESFADLLAVLERQDRLVSANERGDQIESYLQAVRVARDQVDFDFLREEVPRALDQTLDGVGRVAKIVQAMKAFSHPGTDERVPVDLNRSIESTITVARNEWKYVASLETDFDVDLPLVPCFPGELNQVFLNLLINAAQAIGDIVTGTSEKGRIRVTTRQIDGMAEVRVADTGGGIPDAIRSKVFDPFFTTKEVGRGTGQGLSLARSVIVEQHGGSIDFATAPGQGTEFVIRLPLVIASGAGVDEADGTVDDAAA